MNNELKISTIDLTTKIMIDLDSFKEITLKVNGKKIKLDKEKLEKFLSNFCKEGND